MSYSQKSLERARSSINVKVNGSGSVMESSPGMSSFVDTAGMGGNPLIPSSRQNPQATREAYRGYRGWVHASLRIIIQRIAAQPIRLARQRKNTTRHVPISKDTPFVYVKDGGKLVRTQKGSVEWFRSILPASKKDLAHTFELIEKHPLLDAINDPNDIMVRWSVVSSTVASLDLVGAANWWVYQEENKKIRIWPLPFHWFTPIHQNGKFYDKWLIRPDGSALSIEVPGSQVVHFSLPDPGNPFGQIGTLEAQSKAVSADEAIATAQQRAFINDIFPGLAIVVNKLDQTGGISAGKGRVVLTQEQRDNILWMFKNRMGGVYRYNYPFIIDGMIEDIKKITVTNREMDFMESSKITKERVTQGFGTNPISMGQVEASSRASSACADDHLIRNVINPRIELLSEVITAWMNPIFRENEDEQLYCFLEEVASSDIELEIRRIQGMADRGQITVNESREANGYPPLIGADVLLVKPGYIPIPVVRRGEQSIAEDFSIWQPLIDSNAKPEPAKPEDPDTNNEDEKEEEKTKMLKGMEKYLLTSGPFNPVA